MIEPTPDEMRRHRAQIHNQLVSLAMFITFGLSAMLFLAGLLAPLYGLLRAALIRSVILVAIGTILALLGWYLTRYSRSEK